MGDNITFTTTDVMLPRVWTVDINVSSMKEMIEYSISSTPSISPYTLNFMSISGNETLVNSTASDGAEDNIIVDGAEEGTTDTEDGATETYDGVTDTEDGATAADGGAEEGATDTVSICAGCQTGAAVVLIGISVTSSISVLSCFPIT